MVIIWGQKRIKVIINLRLPAISVTSWSRAPLNFSEAAGKLNRCTLVVLLFLCDIGGTRPVWWLPFITMHCNADQLPWILFEGMNEWMNYPSCLNVIISSNFFNTHCALQAHWLTYFVEPIPACKKHISVKLKIRPLEY